MKQKMIFQKISETCVMFSGFFAVHGRGREALTRLLLLYSYTSLNFLCDIGQFLINTVIIVAPFVWVKHSFFVVSIVTCECNILILRKFLFCVCY